MKKLSTMHQKIALIVLASATAAYSFWWYSTIRAMSEVVGFHAGSFLFHAGLILLLVGPILFFAIGFLPHFLKIETPWRLITFIVVCGGVAGILIGESSLLIDEALFRREVDRIETSNLDHYSRARVWPNGASSLVWQRRSGIHATD